MAAATPARPSRCVPGATPCQRSRKRIRSRGLTGAISRRSRSRVYEWTRISSRREHHCSPSSVGSKPPRTAKPSASRRASPDATRPVGE